eukprot:4952210-Lingulodinium_polyedra.AAC.1
MALLLETVPPRLVAWAEGCPCHARRLRRCKNEYDVRVLFAQQYQGKSKTCPCAGMRVPELVAGKLIEVADHVWSD